MNVLLHALCLCYNIIILVHNVIHAVAAKVMEREKHTITGQDLHLEYKMTYVSKDQERMVKLNKLLLCSIPKEADSDYLSLFVSSRLGMNEQEFSIHKSGHAAVVTFGDEYTFEGKN